MGAGLFYHPSQLLCANPVWNGIVHLGEWVMKNLKVTNLLPKLAKFSLLTNLIAHCLIPL